MPTIADIAKKKVSSLKGTAKEKEEEKKKTTIRTQAERAVEQIKKKQNSVADRLLNNRTVDHTTSVKKPSVVDQILGKTQEIAGLQRSMKQDRENNMSNPTDLQPVEPAYMKILNKVQAIQGQQQAKATTEPGREEKPDKINALLSGKEVKTDIGKNINSIEKPKEVKKPVNAAGKLDVGVAANAGMGVRSRIGTKGAEEKAENQPVLPGNVKGDIIYNRDQAAQAYLKQYQDRVSRYGNTLGVTGEDLGSWGSGRTEKVKGVFNIENSRDTLNEQQRLIDAGYFNNGTDYSMMNDAGLANQLAYWEKEKSDKEKLAAELQEKAEADSDWQIDGEAAAERLLEKDGLSEDEIRYQIYDKGYILAQKMGVVGDQELWEDPREIEGIYDTVNGGGAYQRRTAGMSEEEKAQFDDEIAGVIMDITSPQTKYRADLDEAENEAIWAQQQIDDIRRWQGLRSDYSGLVGLTEGSDSAYHPENDRWTTMNGADYLFNYASEVYGVDNTTVHEVYSIINEGGALRDLLIKGNGNVSAQHKYSLMMRDEMVGKFNEYYNAAIAEGREPVEAEAFLDALQPYLTARWSNYEAIQNQEMGRQTPITGTLVTLADTAVQPIELARNAYDYAFNGGKLAGDPNSINYAATRQKQQVRGQVAEDLGDAAILYNAATSGMDSALNVFLAKGLGAAGKVLEGATLTLFGTQAFQTSMQSNLSKNPDMHAAFVKTMIDTLVETATEIVSVENLLSDPTDFIQYILKTAFSEGSEEVVGAIANPYIQKLITGTNEWEELAREVWANREQYEGINDYDDAVRYALRQWNNDIFISGLTGALSTGGGIVVGGTQNLARRYEGGKNILKGETASGVKGAEYLMGIAGGMNNNTKSYQMAEEIGQDQKSGKKISPFRWGKLAESVVQETSGEVAEEAKRAITDIARDALTENGVEEKEADNLAGIIAKARTEGLDTLNRKERKALVANENAYNMFKAMAVMPAEMVAPKVAEKQNQIRDVVQLAKGVAGDSIAAPMVKDSYANADMATEEEYQSAKGRKTGAATEAVHDGNIVQINAIKYGTKKINGKNVDDSTITIQTENGTQEVSAQDVHAINGEMGGVIRFARMNKGIISEKYANTLLKTIAENGGTQKNGSFLDDAVKIVLAANNESGAMPKTNMDAKAAESLWNAAKSEFDEREQQRVAKRSELKENAGKMTFMGAEYGTSRWNEQTKRNMNKADQAEANVLGEIVKRLGFNVNLINDENADMDQFGWEDESGNITINLAANRAKGQYHSLLAVAAHEMTHWLEQNSAKGYAQLRNYAVNQLKAKGVDINQRLLDKIDLYSRHGAELELNGAMAEIVADACDQVLGSRKMAAEMKSINPTLFGKMKEFVRNFTQTLQTVINKLKGSASYEARQLQDYVENIAEIWLGARKEAMTGEITTEANKTNNITQQLSLREGYDFTKSYEEQIDDVIAGIHPVDEPVFIGEIPNVFKGIKLTNLPLVVAKGHVLEMLGIKKRDDNHQFNETFVKKLPKLIAQPIAIIESRSQDQNKKENSVVLIIDDYNPNTNDHVIGAMEIQKTFNLNGQEYDGYMVNSIHGRRNAMNMLKEALENESKNNHGVYYYNNKKANSLRKDPNVNVAIANRIKTFTKHGFIHNINDPDSAVKTVPKKQTDTVQFKRWFGNSRFAYSDKTPITMYYHGTLDDNSRGNVKNGDYYLANNEKNAIITADKDSRTSETYLSVQKPYIVSEEILEKVLNGDTSILDSIKKQGYDAIMLKDKSKVIVTNKNQIKSATNNIGTFDKEISNIKMSVRQDTEYMAAAEAGDTETAQRMVDQAAEEAFKDSKARTSDGKLMRVYHGTSEDFNVFDTSISGGKNGVQEGYGIYLTDNEEIPKQYGGRVISAYVNMKRPAYADKQTFKRSELAKVIKSTCEKEAKQLVDDGSYNNVKEAIQDTWISNYVYTPEYRNINDAYNAVANMIMEQNDNDSDIISELLSGQAIRDYGRAMDFYNNVLTPLTGFDGIWAKWKNRQDGTVSNVLLAFDSSQIKSNEPVTYDDQGNIIPLSERFNPQKKDIRYSVRSTNEEDNIQYAVRSAESYDVEQWMKNVPESSLQTPAEKQLLRDFKGLRMKQELNMERQRKTQEEIRKIEGYAKTRELTAEEKRMLAALKVKLTNAKAVGEQLAEQMYQITGSEGYATLMYQQQKIMDDYVHGRTQQELHDTVDQMNKEADEIRKELSEKMAELARLKENAAVQRVRSYLGASSLKQWAKVVRDNFGSRIETKELEAALAEIALKKRAGEKYQEDVQHLAARIMETIPGEQDPQLRRMRGTTIVLSDEQMKELIGQRYNMKEQLRGLDDRQAAAKEKRIRQSVLKELRGYLAGTGIKIEVGERSTLTDNLSDFTDEFGNGIVTSDNPLDVLDEFLKWVTKRKEAAKNGAEMYHVDEAEVRALIMAAAGEITYKEGDSKATRDELAAAIQEMSGEADRILESIDRIMKKIGAMQKSGHQAQAWTSALQRDVAAAVEYYNKTARLAQETAREQKLRDTIAMLKSEAAEKMAKANEEWRALIERDRQARNTAEDIGAARGRINTAIKRLYKLMSEPKGLKNVPEHMQGLARELISIIVDNDLSEDGRKLSKADKAQLIAAKQKLDAWNARDGAFNMADISGDDDIPLAIINDDMATIYDAIEQWNKPIRGKNRADTLQQRKEIIDRMQEAISEIYGYIRQGQMINIRDRQISVEDAAEAVREGTQGKKFREKTGSIGRAMAALHKGIVNGNMTPEYFFRMLGNKGLSELWEGYHEAENRNGLEMKKAQDKLAEIAEKHGFKNWDMKQKVTLKMDNGDSVEMTVGQLMSLYATWKREQTIGPENSFHLTRGGFYAEQDLRDGWLGSTVVEKKAHRMTENDAATVENLLTDEQRAFVDDVVEFMSDDMSQLGNEASMKAYGIKMYKESYYFPFKIWDGVKNRKSNDAGGAAAAQDRAFHQSFTKARMNNASNALLIGDFMQTAADHIAGMINYATMGLANENLQKVLNQKVTEGVGEDATQRNTQAILDEAYGAEAMAYLNNLKEQLNGGAVKVEKTFYDKLISVFRKNAVAGSLSVAFQQPLSYLRAAIMISPKYLAQGLGREYWSGAYKEMLNHSGVAVIKEMGRFDMNFGQSAREYLTPDGKKSMAKAAWDQITDKATILPEKMDAWTWTRMWVAVKAEQKAMHPEMDVKSDEFLNLCGERFNDIMRRTQVYDSVLVKSQNMRSQNPIMKSITSFMAESTLTANVLMDSLRMAKNGEAGGKAMLAKAGAIFILSAAIQAAIKAAYSSGRSPDDKKTWLENFMNRFGSNMISEMDPMQLIPGYSDIVTLLKGGTLDDDAYNMVSKLITAGETGIDYLLGNSKKDAYRAFEDSVGQIVQLFSKLPAKNLMRDARAMYNWVTGVNYADRESSAAVIGEQWKENFYNADNLLGVINKRLGDAGYQSGNKAYYERIYQARKAGDTETEKRMTEYLTNAKGVSTETIQSKLSGIAKDDDSLSVTEKAEFMAENGSTTADDYVREQLRNGRITADEARKALRKADPTISEDSAWWTVDRIEYQKEKGLEKAPSGQYYRLYDVMDANVSSEIKSVISMMTRHGMKAANIKSQINKKYKEAYMAADSRGKVRIRDAMQKAYKALGYSAADADKVIKGWK